ncbi:hypothetical protein FIM10_01900 [Sphingomonadales bacterium 56]|uniref:hypothetical protein n=1 Tax=unclassified Sphingobium TaxID=2611147 RepID=UPI00191B1487|nr:MULTISPECIES: hypothetical protein [unclassified Sphingobium]MBY2927437.1 hypothetical protein [Sphingomonadales bacterium 56]MBY2957505.1 hypothetical protein [Sphingomonadales bacterium 58]MBY2957548.1 hypothetical protein [Sphingomonadales bacterium 58]
MDYWIENAPDVGTTGDNVRMKTGAHGVVMPRHVALRLARELLAAVRDLEDRPVAPAIPIRTAG